MRPKTDPAAKPPSPAGTEESIGRLVAITGLGFGVGFGLRALRFFAAVLRVRFAVFRAGFFALALRLAGFRFAGFFFGDFLFAALLLFAARAFFRFFAMIGLLQK